MSHGLTHGEARRLLDLHGPNEIVRQRPTPPWAILWEQLRNPMVALLLVACAVSAALGEVADTIAIAAIVVLNALVGFFQEYRAERAVLALRSMTAPRARVMRDGRSEIVPSADVVPGDVLVLEAGDLVAADARLVEARTLRTVEAALTGESVPVHKATTPCPDDAPIGLRHDRVFMGTAVATGTGLAEVTATGMRTEMGRIAHLLATAEEEQTPLHRRLAAVGRMLVLACGGIVALVFVLGVLRGQPALEVLLASISLAVAAVPEGLPAIVTIALAVGVQRLASRNVLVRRLPAVETLGCTTVICTDKTGTLTTGVMTVRDIWAENRQALLFTAAACCDAELDAAGTAGVGDPTEVALLRAAAERGVRREDIERDFPRVAVEPFDPERRYMSVLRSDGTLHVKGAVEAILPRCTEGTSGASEANADMGARGLRVLAVATGRGERLADLTLEGLVGLADPPRSEAIEAVAVARRAGIRTVMITGDHPATARAIAREMGIVHAGEAVEEIVHARVSPEDKLRIVRDWKSRGAVVAMTGDGVNDAPAIREAHVGLAMGRTGTEVTREASDVVLADDNFASIVAGVREGRGVYENIRKTLVYLLGGNVAELLVMLGAAAAGLPLPLLPLQLLWINLVTDGLPALALVMDPASSTLMDRAPRPPGEAMLGRRQWAFIVSVGVLEAAVTLSVFAWALRRGDVGAARNLAFSTLVFSELLRSFAARSPSLVFWAVGPLTNLRLLGVVVLTGALQLLLHHVPWAAALFDLAPLSLTACGLTVAAGLVPVSAVEIGKLVAQWRRRGREGVTS
jgi:Ca2+-transporting ATPase